jgi:predicted nucleotidyltransferase
MHPEIERRVASFAADLRASRVGDDVLALVVSGSAAREEERWVGGELESDIDLMVISRSSTARFDRTYRTRVVLEGHAADNVEGGRIPVTTLGYATLANFEARHRGVVAYGDASVLGRVPMAGPADIPGWEAVRLLANRLFEHLYLRAGMKGADVAVRKSYEAIGESQLVLERRYRPSFRERVAEIARAPLASPVADSGAIYAEAERVRRGESARLDLTPAHALRDLRLQLGAALDQVGMRGGTLEQQLARLADREVHLLHRAYWSLRGLDRRDGRHRPTADPIVQLWRAAVAGLATEISERESRVLVQLWHQCPQILRKGSP